MKTYIDVSDFPLTISLIENYEKIKEEFYKLSEFTVVKPNNILPERHRSSFGKLLYEGDFMLSYTRVVKESCSIYELKAVFGDENGNFTEESINKTKEKLRESRLITPVLESCIAPYLPHVGTVGFNTIYPGSILNKHYGMCTDYIRFHLGIECDPGAMFYVENLQPRTWEPGKVFAFSDGETFHGTTHTGSKPRTVLILDLHKQVIPELKSENWV
jgi:hypothetical protein